MEKNLMEKYIGTKTAIEILGINKHTLYKLVSQHILSCVKYGDALKFVREDVEELKRTGWTWNVQVTE